MNKKSNQPIILVENEVTAGGVYDHWQDATGERYQYPNQYKNKVLEGRRFIYYRGSRRADGTKQTPEYFGHGVIGETYVDPTTDTSTPKRTWKWLCNIAEYSPFESPVLFKKMTGDYYEQISQNQWGVAVRELSEDVYKEILTAGGVEVGASSFSTQDAPIPTQITAKNSLLSKLAQETNNPQWAMSYLSKYTKEIGDLGERIVLEHFEKILQVKAQKSLRWVASLGEKPGYDIEYCLDKTIKGIEVKATTASCFASIQLTANELKAAEEMQDNYYLVLVASVLSSKPAIEVIQNPVKHIEQGKLTLKPVAYRISL